MISLPSRGALSVLSIEVEKELEEKDLLDLRFMPDNSPPTLKTISARHRRTAMMVARGFGNEHIAEALGYTPARVSQLRFDPAFAELVAYYEDQIHEESLTDEKRIQEKLRAMTETGLDLINERLEDPAHRERISTSELRQLVAMGADRTVAPPKAIVNTNAPPAEITLNFGTTLKPKEITPAKVIDQDGNEEGREE